jgi:small-conductance mechanosensitive channel
MDTVIKTLQNFANPATLPGALSFGVIFLAIAWVIARVVHRLVMRAMQNATDPTGFLFFDQLLRISVYAIMFILYAQLVPALHSLGTALLASVRLASIVIGLAAQQTLGNMIAGFALLLYRPIKVGDRVQLVTPRGLVTATIDSLSLGHTLLLDDENNQIIVPNSIMSSVVLIRVEKK